MYSLDYSEFYITNVCNLNCDNCNRFNNYAFAGHEKWSDHAEQYAQWSKKLNIRHIAIIGGEPLLNPDLINWIRGLFKLWPNSNHRIITNGTQFERWPELYSELEKMDGKSTIEISHHNADTWNQEIETVRKFLGTKVTEYKIPIPNPKLDTWLRSYKNIKDPLWPEINSVFEWNRLSQAVADECCAVYGLDPESWFGADWRNFQDNYYMVFRDENRVVIQLYRSWEFNQSALTLNSDSQTFRLYHSDPVKAMSNCNFKTCHHFMHGKLYKCAPVALLPEFAKQFKIELDDERKKLLNSYQAAIATMPDIQMQLFLKNLTEAQHIPQCSFCPESYAFKRFKAGTKKIKIIKKKH